MYLATPGSGTTGENSAHAFGDLRLAFTDGADTTLDDRFTFRYNGNFGVGTTNPAATIHSHAASPQLRLTSSADSNTPLAQIGYAGGSGYFLRLGDAANNEDIMFRTYGDSFIQGGSLHIGSNDSVASSAEVFSVYNASTGHTRLKNSSDSYGTLYLENASTTANTFQPTIVMPSGGGNRGNLGIRYTDSVLGIQGGGGISFRAGSTTIQAATEVMFITTTGVGINEIAPDAKLTVAGTNRAATSTNTSNATANEKQIYLVEGSMGARVGEWVHSSDTSSSPTQTPMISWYKFVLPGGYSGAGTPGFLEITNHMTGKHASGACVEQYKILFPNNGSSNANHGGMNMAHVDKVYAKALTGGNYSSYTTSLSTVFYYLDTGAGTSGATLYMKVTHAAREPFFTMHARYIGGHGHNQNYHQYMAFLGTDVNNDHSPSNITALTTNVGVGVQ